VTAYNVGVVGAASGFGLNTILEFSGLYNVKSGNSANANTAYGLNSSRATSITQGYNDYKDGKWDIH